MLSVCSTVGLQEHATTESRLLFSLAVGGFQKHSISTATSKQNLYTHRVSAEKRTKTYPTKWQNAMQKASGVCLPASSHE
eukprot:1227718-Amphidinium_carterae.1